MKPTIATTSPIRIVIADDNIFFRSGFKKIMQSQYPKEIEFIADVSTGKELIQTTRDYYPDVVITDIKMPEIDGIEACRKIKEEHPEVNVIGFSMFDDIHYVMGMLQSGASGYLVKSSSKEEFIDAIYSTYNNNFYCSPTISDKLYQNKQDARRDSRKLEFSKQEKIVIKLICQQLSTKEIALKMNLATRTIDHYREHILEKIGARNVVGIALYAVCNNIVHFEEINRSS